MALRPQREPRRFSAGLIPMRSTFARDGARGGLAAIRRLNTLGSAVVRGTAANLASMLALAACSKTETGSALAGINAISHWAWGDADASRNRFSWKHTMIGAVTNQAASVFWAFCFARLFASRTRRLSVPRLLGQAAAVSALACAVDYTVTPKRLTPGYELRLSKRSIAAVYVAFAGGLALGSVLLRGHTRWR
jgi:hypothetical protein